MSLIMSEVFLTLLNSLLPGFMSVTHKHPQFMRDPNVCGVKHLD